MSSTIEFERRAYKIKDGGRGDSFLALSKMGESNVFEVMLNGDEVIARDWEFFEFGSKHEIMDKASRWAKNTESGILRYGNGYTKPEDYIKNWRKTLRDAGTFEDFKTEFYERKGIIQFFKDGAFGNGEAKPDEEKLRELNGDWKREVRVERELRCPDEKSEKVIYTLLIESIDNLKEFVKQKRRFKGFLTLYLRHK